MPHQRTIPRVCRHCGRSFLATASHVRNSPATSCSIACAQASRHRDDAARFWQKVDRSGGADACWPWQRPLSRNGYGIFSIRGKHLPAHRFAYELLVGPIPEGLEIDHLCRVRHCVNPAHLEPVTPQVNALRGNGAAGRNARKTSCRNGHLYSAENTWLDHRGHRYCRICLRENHRRYATRRRQRASDQATEQ
jgi:hypothetical protein